MTCFAPPPKCGSPSTPPEPAAYQIVGSTKRRSRRIRKSSSAKISISRLAHENHEHHEHAATSVWSPNLQSHDDLSLIKLQKAQECPRKAGNGQARAANQREPQDDPLRNRSKNVANFEAVYRRLTHAQETVCRIFHEEKRHTPV